MEFPEWSFPVEEQPDSVDTLIDELELLGIQSYAEKYEVPTLQGKIRTFKFL